MCPHHQMRKRQDLIYVKDHPKDLEKDFTLITILNDVKSHLVIPVELDKNVLTAVKLVPKPVPIIVKTALSTGEADLG